MDLQDKTKKSAEMLGVVLGIPAYVDPEKGFSTEKVIKWENGDQIQITANWLDGEFNYAAYIGMIDPKTNELAFVSGAIATSSSLESLIGQIDAFVQSHAEEREVEEPDANVVADYQAANQELQDLLLDPDHDVDAVRECSNKMKEIEIHLREQGFKPGDLLI